MINSNGRSKDNDSKVVVVSLKAQTIGENVKGDYKSGKARSPRS